MRFELSRRARRQIDKVQAWWIEHRSSARTLFLDELASAELLLRAHPELGQIFQASSRGPIRRLLLVETAHHLYYRYSSTDDTLVVLHVWGATRARGPRR